MVNIIRKSKYLNDPSLQHLKILDLFNLEIFKLLLILLLKEFQSYLIDLN